MEEMKYFIWSYEYCGWWRSDRAGYTVNLRVAGRYSEDVARGIVESANRHTECHYVTMVSVDAFEPAVVREGS